MPRMKPGVTGPAGTQSESEIMTTRTSSVRLALMGAVAAGVIVASTATDAFPVGETQPNAPSSRASAAAAMTCPRNGSWNYVDLDSAFGSVVSARGLSCRRAAGVLSLTMLTRSGQLTPTEGAPLGWACKRRGAYDNGARYRCWKGSESFRAKVFEWSGE